jgi:hypothetical protein
MWVLKFLPDWIFYTLLISGFAGLVLSKFVPVYYRTAVQAASAAFFVFGIYMAGAIYDNNAWKARVNELEKKVAEAQAESAKENTKIVEKVVTKREYYRERGNDIINYIDREVVKYDTSCEIPKEFVEIYNKAATK